MYDNSTAANLAVLDMRRQNRSASLTSGASYAGTLDGKAVVFNGQASTLPQSVLIIELTSAEPSAALLEQAELSTATLAARINSYFATAR
jgi:hypothetical protein